MKNNKKTGFSLIELLLVLGVIAVFGVAAFMIYEKVSNARIISTAVQNANIAKQATEDLVRGANLAPVDANGYIKFSYQCSPSDGIECYKDTGTEPLYYAGGDKGVSYDYGLIVDKNSNIDAQITVNGIPNSAICTGIATAYWKMFDNFSIDNGESMLEWMGGDPEYDLDGKGMSVSIISKQCAAFDGNRDVGYDAFTVSGKFYKPI